MTTYTIKTHKSALGAEGSTVTVDELQAAGVNIEAAVASGVIEPSQTKPKPAKED